MRPYLIAGNWKMNQTPEEAVQLAGELVRQLQGVKHKLLIAPSFVCLPGVAEVLKGSSLLLGAQNMAAEEEGAFTGETSVNMLLALGVKAVILGHSERRHIFGETDELINAKVRLALAKGLEPILCVGETLEERQAGRAGEVVKTQTRKGLAGVSPADVGRVTLAYEPVWAIGTGKTATPQDAEEIHGLIRDCFAGLYSPREAENLVIQYGGSVKGENAAQLMAQPNIDGALVGGASLKAAAFVPIARFDEGRT
ncbi:MAG: triose-phosphate isomerase [Spirochaetales bacterium]|jgi:triosephosphate isomerase|nr:triose-phosphate isomerase [Spirochaetales bacterium]